MPGWIRFFGWKSCVAKETVKGVVDLQAHMYAAWLKAKIQPAANLDNFPIFTCRVSP